MFQYYTYMQTYISACSCISLMNILNVRILIKCLCKDKYSFVLYNQIFTRKNRVRCIAQRFQKLRQARSYKAQHALRFLKSGSATAKNVTYGILYKRTHLRFISVTDFKNATCYILIRGLQPRVFMYPILHVRQRPHCGS